MSETLRENPEMPDFANMKPEEIQTLYIDGLHGEALMEDQVRGLDSRVSALEAKINGQPEPRRPRPADPERNETNRKRLVVAGVVGVLAVGAILGIASASKDGNSAKAAGAGTEQAQPGTTNTGSSRFMDAFNKVKNAVKGSGDSLTAATASTVPSHNVSRTTATMSRTQQLEKYAARDSGADNEGLIGNISINPENKEASFNSLLNEINHNPQTLAEMQTALAAARPSYGTATTPAATAKMNQLIAKYRNPHNFDARVKAAQTVNATLLKDWKNVSFMYNTGEYSTVIANADGTVHPGTNVRNNDVWMVLKRDDGSVLKIRSCAQLVEAMKTVTTTVTPHAPKTVRTSVTPPSTPPATPAPHHPRPHHPGTPPQTPPHQPPHQPPHNPPNNPPNNPPEHPPKVCPPGYEGTPPNCLHPAASGPPPEAVQAPRPQPATPGYTPGNAEAVDGTQHGPINNPDPTPHGTEIPGSQAGDVAPPIGDHGEVATPGSSAPDNPQHVPGSETPGTTGNTSNPADSPAAQTPGTGSTSGPGTDTGMPN